MCEIYKFGKNPFSDTLMELLYRNIDLNDYLDKLYDILEYILKEILEYEKEVVFLDFEIKSKKNGYYQVIPNNIICALWFSGYYPKNVYEIYNQDGCIIEDNEYVFDSIKRKLTKIN